MNNILLVPSSGKGAYRSTRPLQSIVHLKRALKRSGLDVETIDRQAEDLEGTVAKIASIKPRALGISSTSHEWRETLELCRRAREVSPNSLIILGGYISIVPEIMEMCRDIDILFRGEGEIRAPEVFRAALQNPLSGSLSTLFRTCNYEKIPGLIIRAADRLIDTGVAPRIRDIDDFVPEADDLIWIENRKIAFVYTSRGCYAKCKFCNIIEHMPNGIVSLSEERVNRLIEELAGKGVSVVHFFDDEFLYKRGSLGRLDQIGPALRKNNIKIWIQTRVQDIRRNIEEILRWKDVIRAVEMGVESFSDSQLKRWTKGTSKRANLEAIDLLSRNGIEYRAYMIWVDRYTDYPELMETTEEYVKLPGVQPDVPYCLGTTNDFYVKPTGYTDRWGDAKLEPEHLEFIDRHNRINELRLARAVNRVRGDARREIITRAKNTHILNAQAFGDQKRVDEFEEEFKRLREIAGFD